MSRNKPEFGIVWPGWMDVVSQARRCAAETGPSERLRANQPGRHTASTPAMSPPLRFQEPVRAVDG
jgi:hypothetical protein